MPIMSMLINNGNQLNQSLSLHLTLTTINENLQCKNRRANNLCIIEEVHMQKKISH